MQAELPHHKTEQKDSHPVLRFAVEWGPFIFLIFYLFILLLIRFKLPEPETIIRIVTDFYAAYGYPTVFLSGLIEGIFLLGFYVPGSAAILLGAVAARSGVVSLPGIILVGTAGLVIAYTINYFLGKYGWFRVVSQFGFAEPLEIAQKKLGDSTNKAIFFGYISPNSASFVSTAAGVMKLPFRQFFLMTVISQTFWSIVWGTLAYLLGDVFVEFFIKYMFLIIVAVVALYFLRMYWKKRKTKP